MKLGVLCSILQEYFGLDYFPHLGLGRFVSVVVIV